MQKQVTIEEINLSTTEILDFSKFKSKNILYRVNFTDITAFQHVSVYNNLVWYIGNQNEELPWLNPFKKPKAEIKEVIKEVEVIKEIKKEIVVEIEVPAKGMISEELLLKIVAMHGGEGYKEISK